MIKVLKALGISVLYILLYFGVQMLVLLPSMIVLVVKLVITEPESALADVQAMTDKLYELMQGFVNFSNLVSALLTIGVLYIIFAIRKKSFLRKVQWNRVSLKSLIPIALLGASLNFFISTALVFLPIPSRFFEGLEQMAKLMNSGNVWVDFAAIALAAPLVEEVIFRGCIFTTLRRNMPLPFAITVQAVLFGLLHWYAISIVYAFLIGILMAWAFVTYRSIWASIMLHVFFNAASFGARWLPETNKGVSIGVLIISGFFIAVSLAYLIQKTKEKYAAV